MSNPYKQAPNIVVPYSTVLGKQCPGCGELFKLDDTFLMASRTRGDPPTGDAVAIHVRCTEPRGGAPGAQTWD